MCSHFNLSHLRLHLPIILILIHTHRIHGEQIKLKCLFITTVHIEYSLLLRHFMKRQIEFVFIQFEINKQFYLFIFIFIMITGMILKYIVYYISLKKLELSVNVFLGSTKCYIRCCWLCCDLFVLLVYNNVSRNIYIKMKITCLL